MCALDPHRQRRRSIRLRGFDYSQRGAYFVTICTHGREPMLGAVVGGDVRLSEFGLIAKEEWMRSAAIRDEISLDEFVVMPNHIHGVVCIEQVGAHGRAPLQEPEITLRRAPRSIGSIIAGFKSAATRRINAARGTPGARVWQRNYYEHVVRDDAELDRIRGYILSNAANWESDEYYAV